VITDGPEPGTWTALAGMANAMRDFLSAWEGLRSEPEEYRELDGGRVLIFTSFSARGKTSGLEVGQIWTKGAHLFHVRGDRVTKLAYYMK
jgi:hypothetical protein